MNLRVNTSRFSSFILDPSFLTIFFILAFLFTGTDARAIDKIRIAASNPNMPNLTVAMAQRRGFFKDENLEVEIIRMNPNVAITALATGDVDYCQLFGAV
ncbi:MAG TPA: ABC transporter substrate-binding protein, partial [Candidatus Binatus sp.]|nr:ABC transporter substrate-binding protein [Candidatus Binatus sp.]